MKLAILAVLLAVMQTSPPVPRQAANGSRHSSQQSATKTRDKQTPSADAQAVQETPSAPATANKAGNIARPNDKQSVSVIELPTVSVGKDRWDKTAWFFSLVLIGIGGFGVCYAARTLRAIESQTEHLVKSERAWIHVPEIIKFQILSAMNPPPEVPFVWLRPYIANKGRTHARIIRISGRTEVLDRVNSGWVPPKLGEQPLFSESDILMKRDIILPPDEGIN